MSPVIAETDAYSTGYVIGQWTAVALMLAGIVKCWLVARRPAANTKALLALSFLLMAWLLGSGVRLFKNRLEGEQMIVGLIGLGMMGLIMAAITLAILGLLECRREKERYLQGKAQAIWTLGLVSVLVIAFVLGAIRGFTAKSRLTLGTQPPPGETLVKQDLNFMLRAPGPPWVQMDAVRLNPSAKLAFRRTSPEVFCVVIAEKIGRIDFDNDQLAEITESRMRSVAQELNILGRVSSQVGPLLFKRLEADAELKTGVRFSYAYWLCATNGWAYQFVFWGRQSDRALVGDEAAKMVRGFALVDPQRKAPVLGGFTEDYVSPDGRFVMRLKDSEWHAWPNLENAAASASMGALHGQDAALVVSSVSLQGLQPHPEAIYQGLLLPFGFRLEAEKVIERRDISESGMSGIEVQLTRQVRSGNGVDYLYRLKLLHGGGHAFLVGAWVDNKHTRRAEILADALQRVELRTPAAPLSSAPLDANQKRVHRLVLNGMGLFYSQAGQNERSARFFQTVVDLEGTVPNTPYLGNLVQAHTSAGKLAEALAVLDQHAEAIGTQPELRATRAFLQGSLGQSQAAVSNYAGLFADDYRDEAHFKEYVKLLNRTQDSTQTLATVEKFLLVRDTPEIRLQQAALLKLQNRLPEAIALLDAQRLKHPFHAGVAYSLADAMIQAKRHADALALSQDLVAQRVSLANAYFLKGRAEYGLKWYREAKESFERAAKESPTDTDIKSFLDHVSGMLGEGANTAIKEPISPVAIPPSLLEPAADGPPSEAAQEFGATYSRRVTAVAYEKGGEMKTTEYVKARPLTSAGVSIFSSFQLVFNPLGEELYVNRLEIKDAKGSLVSTGRVADYYLLDDRSTTAATTRKVLNVPVSGLQPGYSVELVSTRRELGRAEGFPFFAHAVSRMVPVQESVLFLRGDTTAVRVESSPRKDAEELAGGMFWRWRDPPVIRWEPLQTPASEFSPTLWLNDISARWPAIASNYLAGIQDRLQPSAAVQALARQITAGATNEPQKILAVARHVQTNCVYKAIEFGRRARVPQLPADVVRNRYGDCKDHAVLAQQLLRAVGVAANLALVSVNAPLRRNLPSLDQFDHMIVHVPTPAGGKYLDCTDKGEDFARDFPHGVAGRDALVLDAANPRLERIPDYSADASTISFDRTVVFTNRTELMVTETFTLTGVHGGYLRRYLQEQTPAGRRSYASALLAGESGELLQFKEDNLAAGGEPLVLRLTYRLRDRFHESGSELVGNLPACLERAYIAVQTVEKRFSPFQVDVPLVMEGTIRVAAPPGRRFKPLAEPVKRLESRFVNCQVKSELDTVALRIQYRLNRPSGRFPAGEYAEYCQAHVRVASLLSPPLASEPVTEAAGKK